MENLTFDQCKQAIELWHKIRTDDDAKIKPFYGGGPYENPKPSEITDNDFVRAVCAMATNAARLINFYVQAECAAKVFGDGEENK